MHSAHVDCVKLRLIRSMYSNVTIYQCPMLTFSCEERGVRNPGLINVIAMPNFFRVLIGSFNVPANDLHSPGKQDQSHIDGNSSIANIVFSCYEYISLITPSECHHHQTC